MIFEAQNSLTLCGQVSGEVTYSHESHNERFYTFPLKVERLSHTYDTIIVLVNESKFQALGIQIGDFICITGELRSFNNKTGIGSRLVITAFAKNIARSEPQHKNELYISGVICKEPVYRKTPLGREICDLMIAINRRYGRADYLPCIVWGKMAYSCSDFRIGTAVSISGRVQSREYIKIVDDNQETRITYEVSVSSIELIEKE